MATKTTHSASAHAAELGEAMSGSSLWQTLDEQEARQEQSARSEALETQALYHAQCDDAASACWYIARSLGAARQLEPGGEPSLELLFELLGALADLPTEIANMALPEAIGGEQLGISELCQQLAMARSQSQDVWVDAELAAPVNSLTH